MQNALDSETFGVDVVVSYEADRGDLGSTNFTASANDKDGQIASVNIANANGTALFDAEPIYDFEHGQSRTRGVFTATRMPGLSTFLGRASRLPPARDVERPDLPVRADRRLAGRFLRRQDQLRVLAVRSHAGGAHSYRVGAGRALALQ